jgi:large subunit ribosomal protein LP0
MKPFEYGMTITSVYDDGSILPEEVLNLDPASLLTKFQGGVRNIAGLSLSAGIPVAATIPLIISNAFRNIAALSLESGYLSFYLDSK